MRRRLLHVFLTLLLLTLLPAGNMQASSPSAQAQLQKVDVASDTDSTSVVISVQGTLAPTFSTLNSPPRIVIALPDTVVATPYNHLSVQSRQVRAVRIGMDGQRPPTTRVVIDCVLACQYDLLPNGQNKIVVKVHAPSGTGGATAPTGESKSTAVVPFKDQKLPPSPPPGAAPPAREPLYAQQIALPSKYSGPGGCAASSCHGSVQPRTMTRIYQNEYSIWIAKDLHTRAFSALRNPVSLRIGKILNLGSPDRAPKCLVCHSLYVGADQRAQTFALDDGVSCESCHGPASGWLGPHTTRDWPHEKSLKLGMYDTRNLHKRAEKCLTCHLGTADKFVDHEMIAAGHPDLTFELGVFTSSMPPHWKMPEQNDPWRQVQAWGTGLAVQLRESLNRLARRASGPIWPEYAELDCFACHHKVTASQDSWRQARGYPGRRPGNPPWNQSRVVVFRDLVDEVFPQVGKQLDDEVIRLAGLINQLNGDREQVAASATRAAALADQLAKQVEAQTYDRSLTLRLLRRVARDGTAIAEEGERSAEQAAFTLDSLFRAYDQNVKPPNASELRAGIDGLFQQLQDPPAYSAPRFAAQMQKVSELLGR